MIFRAYQYRYPITTAAPTAQPNARHSNPSIKFTPAALEAMTTEKGLMVENVVPMEPARKMAPTHMMESYPRARKTGTRIG